MELVILVFFLFLIIVEVLSIVLLLYKGIVPVNHQREEEKPVVTVLLAVRNEGNNIRRCVESLVNQTYAKEKYHITIGNDNSTDNTAEVLGELKTSHPWIEVYDIPERGGEKARAKVRVLSHLIKHAKGKYYLITDADMELPPKWIETMVNSIGNRGVLSGITGVEDSKRQNYEWLTTLGRIYIASTFGFGTTSIGNNMILSAACYIKTKGFENFTTLTEDKEIYDSVKKAGYKRDILFTPEIIGKTRAVCGFKNLFQQRKRWMTGAFKVSRVVLMVLVIQVLVFPMALAGIFINPLIAVALLGGYFLARVLTGAIILKKLKEPVDLFFLGITEVTSNLLNLYTLLSFMNGNAVIWKAKKHKM